MTFNVETDFLSQLNVFGSDGVDGPFGYSRSKDMTVLAMLTGTGTPHYKWRADTFKRVAETGPRLANVVGKGRLSLADFLPEV